MRFLISVLFTVAVSKGTLSSADAPEALPPTHTDVSYGSHATNVLDLWKGRS